jgi:glycosyltransferase involved in cell wall biosynthesis
MKIILVHNTYREPGGEDVVFESEKRLLQKAGHTVIPFVRSNMELHDSSFLDRIAIARQMIWSSKTRHEFTAILKKECPDIVHVHNTFMAISPSIYSACSDQNVPVVQTLHNFRLLCPAGNFFRDNTICTECLDENLLRSVRHGCYRNSRGATASVALMLAVHRALDTWRSSITRFITLTEFAKRQFIASGFPSDRIVVKPNFMDPDPGERAGSHEYAVLVGRLMDNKGVGVLLDAWKKLPAQHPLQIVGDGPERAAMESEAARCKLAGITFRGRLPRDKVIEIVKGARFAIVPSLLYEAFPMCIVESFACGTPVVCSGLGGLAEVVEDQFTGLHFKPGDAEDLAHKVEWAWNHPFELAQMGRAARRKYETDYTAEENYSLLMQIYDQALAAAGSRRLAVEKMQGDFGSGVRQPVKNALISQRAERSDVQETP